MLARIRKYLPSWVLTVVVGVVVYWVLRDQVLDAYPVPTPSMEPTIEGDDPRGDVVLVDKTFDNRARPGRFDTIVFKHAEDKKIVVKRVVALPGEYVMINNHDLWVGATKQDLRRVEKDPVQHADLLAIRWDSARSSGGFASGDWRRERVRESAGGSIEIAGAGSSQRDLFPTERWKVSSERRHTRWRAAWNLTYRSNITTGYLDGFDQLQEHKQVAFDFGVRVRVRAAPEASLWIELGYGRDSWALCYEGSGSVSLWKNGKPVADAAQVTAPALSATTPVQLVFLYLDGAFRLAAGDRTLLAHPVPFDDLRTATWNEGRGAVNGLAIAVLGGKATLEAASVVHDFHYTTRGEAVHATYEPFRVEAGHYFVLGDNSRNSRDSRHYGPVHESAIIGRPIAIAAPWNRIRLIKR